MKTGTSGSVEQQDERRRDVDGRDPGEHRDRHDAGEDDLRQVAGEVRLEAVDALDRGRRDLGARRAVGAARLRADAARRARASGPDSTLDAARRPATSNPHASAARPAKTSRRSSSAVETASSEAPSKARATTSREQRGLEQQEQGGDDPDRRVGREQHARRPCAAEQARVERAHGYG